MSTTNQSSTSATPSPSAGQAQPAREAGVPAELDLARLAQKIYKLMQRDLQLDRERRVKS
jgi:hypothetical protein